MAKFTILNSNKKNSKAENLLSSISPKNKKNDNHEENFFQQFNNDSKIQINEKQNQIIVLINNSLIDFSIHFY